MYSTISSTYFQFALSEISRLKIEAKLLMKKGNLSDYFSKLLELERLEKQARKYQFN